MQFERIVRYGVTALIGTGEEWEELGHAVPTARSNGIAGAGTPSLPRWKWFR